MKIFLILQKPCIKQGFFYNTACRCQQTVPLIILMSRKGNVHAITLNIPFPMVDFSLSVILRFPHSKTLSDFIFSIHHYYTAFLMDISPFFHISKYRSNPNFIILSRLSQISIYIDGKRAAYRILLLYAALIIWCI